MKKIVDVRVVKLATSDQNTEILGILKSLQTQFPMLEWDVTLHGIQFNTYATFKGSVVD